ncbi:hypothetical protein ACFE04_030612 [Oxalis oulophora]
MISIQMLFCFLLFFLHLCSKQFECYPTNLTALYVFGDSLIDSGNNNHINTTSKADYWPYGIDFHGGKTTGRTTNGKTVADFAALHFGLPFAPAYLGLSKSQRGKMITGINFASAGCGILPGTEFIGGLCMPFDNQTDLFRRTVTLQFENETDLKLHLSKSLIFINIGINDIELNNVNATKCLRMEAFSELLLREYSLRLRNLYNFGARNFLINNLPPSGCIPVHILNAKPEDDCIEEQNKVLYFYNMKLPTMLRELQLQLPGSLFVHADIHNFLVDLRTQAKEFGITELKKPCCPDGYNGTIGCHHNAAICENRDAYFFFDQYHPSEIVNEIYAKRCFEEQSICTFMG